MNFDDTLAILTPYEQEASPRYA